MQIYLRGPFPLFHPCLTKLLKILGKVDYWITRKVRLILPVWHFFDLGIWCNQ